MLSLERLANRLGNPKIELLANVDLIGLPLSAWRVAFAHGADGWPVELKEIAGGTGELEESAALPIVDFPCLRLLARQPPPCRCQRHDEAICAAAPFFPGTGGLCHPSSVP